LGVRNRFRSKQRAGCDTFVRIHGDSGELENGLENPVVLNCDITNINGTVFEFAAICRLIAVSKGIKGMNNEPPPFRHMLKGQWRHLSGIPSGSNSPELDSYA
jgi:hypothetical protein